MNIQQLKEILAFSGDMFSLGADKLSSPNIETLFTSFLPQATLKINQAKADTSSSDKVIINGDLGYALFSINSLHIEAMFTVVNNQAEVSITLNQFPDSWKLSECFPALKNSVADSLTYKEPQFLLDSLCKNSLPDNFMENFGFKPNPQAIESGFKKGLSFSSKIGTSSGMSSFFWLLGTTELLLSGPIEFYNDTPRIWLKPESTIEIDIGHFSFHIGLHLVSLFIDFPGKPLVLYQQTFNRLETDIIYQGKESKLQIPIYADFFNGDSSSITFSSNLEQASALLLDDISGLLADTAVGPIVEGAVAFPALNNISLDWMSFSFNTKSQKITSISTQITFIKDWDVFPSLININDMHILFNVLNPTDKSKVTISVFGDVLVLNYFSLDGYVSIPHLHFEGGLKEGNTIDIIKLVNTELGLQIDMPQISCTQFKIKGDRGSQSYSFAATVGTDWTIFKRGDISFALTEIAMRFAYQKNTTPATTGAVIGKVTFSGVDILVSASNEAAGQGWTFSGSTGDGEDINLTQLIDELLNMFGLPALPNAVPEIDLKNLSVEFNTKSKSFTFHGETKVTEKKQAGFNWGEIDGIVDITSEVGDDNQRHLTGSIEGDLKIGDSLFKLKYNLGEKSFTATWEGEQGKTLGLNDFLEAFGLEPVDIPSFLDFGLTEVSFEYDISVKRIVLSATAKLKNSSATLAVFFAADLGGATKGFVFGFDFQDTIYLSQLPKIGDELKSLDMITIKDIQIIIANKEVDKFIVPPGFQNSGASLNISKGVSFNAVIDFTDKQESFSLPMNDNQSPPSAGGSASPAAEAGLWINVQRSFGPVHFQRIGLQYRDSKIWFLLDAGLVTAGLTIDLMGLGLGVTIAKPFQFAPALQGMDVNFQEGGVEINGGLLKVLNPPAPFTCEYNGQLIIETGGFGIAAYGSYANGDNQTSLFVFGVLNAPLGGPEEFFIIGLAAGFGYNRGLRIPQASKLSQFPLVQGALDPADIAQQDPMATLKLMSDYIYPSIGEYWLAAGIKFTTYDLLNSFALLTAAFGTQFEIALLGFTGLDVPTESPELIVHAILALEAKFVPSDGLIAVEGALTPASYVIDPNIHLTGGFAFCLWYDGDHAGDFVATLGGYHPDFKRPSYYPTVERLGFRWQFSSEIEIKGGCYFALVPSSLMAGIGLSLTYHTGNLKAWFSANADFLIEWKPFHYDIKAGITLGASYRVDVWFVHHTFSIELSATLNIWGPPFAGKVHIHWSVISFTIHFGAQDNEQPPKLDWDDFQKSFLPHPQKDKNILVVCTIKVTDGLIKENQSDNSAAVWVMNPQHLALQTRSAIPSTAITFNGQAIGLSGQITDLAFFPMKGEPKLAATHTVVISKKTGNNQWQPIPANDINYQVVTENMPKALWSPVAFSKLDPDGTISNVAVGLKLTPSPIVYYELPSQGGIPVKKLLYEYITGLSFILGVVAQPVGKTFSQAQAMSDLKSSIMSQAVQTERTQLINGLLKNKLNVRTDINLNRLANSAQNVFTADPVLASLGT